MPIRCSHFGARCCAPARNAKLAPTQRPVPVAAPSSAMIAARRSLPRRPDREEDEPRRVVPHKGRGRRQGNRISVEAHRRIEMRRCCQLVPRHQRRQPLRRKTDNGDAFIRSHMVCQQVGGQIAAGRHRGHRQSDQAEQGRRRRVNRATAQRLCGRWRVTRDRAPDGQDDRRSA